MKFGIYPSVTRGDGNLHALFNEVCEEASVAEASGFSWCLVGEHHQEPALASPLLTAGLVATCTRSIGVGTAVLLMPLHHPVHVAEQAAMIDALAPGRLVLGVGIGYQQKDFDQFGVPLRDRGALLDEGLDMVRRLWTEPAVDFQGRSYRIAGARLGVRPAPDAIPLWIGANSEAALPRAATRGDAWLASRTKPFATVRDWAARYRDAAAAAGRPARVYVIRDAWIAQGREDAVAGYERAMRDSLPHYAGNDAYVRQIEAMLVARAAGQARDAGDSVIIGSPEDCIEQCARWGEAGVDGLILRFRHPGGPAHREIIDAIRLFGATVVAGLGAAAPVN